MIEIEKSEPYRSCNVCYAIDHVYNITFRYEGTNSGTQIALCDKCMQKLFEKIREVSDDKCPICEYPFEMCQCKFGGSAHPDRSKRARVVADNIYLLTDKQIEHLKKVQSWWDISYGDVEMQSIKQQLKGDNHE